MWIIGLLLTLSLTKSLVATNLTIQSVDSVDWDANFSWSTNLSGDDKKVEMSIDFTCYVNYNSFPLRIHCTGDVEVGYEDNLDAKITVQFGAEIRWDQLENIETEPALDFYFAFTSPEVSWDWGIGKITYIDSKAYPSTDGYYVQTVNLHESVIVRDGKSWEVNVCATLFGDLISNKEAVSNVELAAIKAVAESGELSGSDLCIKMVVTPKGKKGVDLDFLAEVYALDETRINWDKIPTSLELLYSAVQCPSIDHWKYKNECETSEGTFEWLRDLITGMDSGYHKEIDIPALIADFIEEQKEYWEKVVDPDKNDPDYKRYLQTSKNAGPLLTSTGSIRLSPQEDPILSLVEIIGIAVGSTVLLGVIVWMIYTKSKHGKLRNPIYCCNAAEEDEACPQGYVDRMRAQYEGNYKAPLIADSTFCILKPEGIGIQQGKVASTVKMFEENNVEHKSLLVKK